MPLRLPRKLTQPARQPAPMPLEPARDFTHLNVVVEEVSSGRPSLGERLGRIRQKITIANYVTTLVVGVVLSASLLSGYYAFSVQYEKALKDTWAIIFLEGEQFSRYLADELPKVSATEAARRKRTAPGVVAEMRRPDVFYSVSSGDLATPLTEASGKEGFTARQLGLKDFDFQWPWNVMSVPGNGSMVMQSMNEDALGRSIGRTMRPGTYLVGWRVDFEKWLGQSPSTTLRENTVYIATRAGRLVYTNRPEVTNETLSSRPLVARFIAGKLSAGEIEFEGAGKVPHYGFFFEVPGTNLVVFSETPKAKALEVVRRFAIKFGLVLLVMLIVLFLGLQVPLASITRPLRELVWLSREVSRGNFAVRTQHRGFGEVDALSLSFSKMASNLVAREEAIQKLMVEQQTKIRLEREFAMAKSLQDNFLPHGTLSDGAGLELASIYVPAAQVAGDWYTFHFDEASGETIIALADVSGHDMAASMFTAVIAGLFYEMREAFPGQFPLREFAARLNRRILQFGHAKWHATLQVARFVKGSGKLEIMNCGHTFPFRFATGGAKASSVRLPSKPVGLGREEEVALVTIDFAPGDTLLMFTDGVTEARRDDGKPFGTKRLFKVAEAAVERSPAQIIQAVRGEFDKYRAGTPALDDLCLVCFRNRS